MLSPFSASSSTSGTRRRTVPTPCASTIPYSASRPRTWLQSAVRAHAPAPREAGTAPARPAARPTLTATAQDVAGTPRRLGNRPRVVVVVLVPANVRLDVLRGNEPDLVAQPTQLASPVMRARARFHPHHATGHVRKVRTHLTAPHHLAPQHLPVPIAPHHMKHVLCQVQANRRSLVHGLPLLSADGGSYLHLGAHDADEVRGRRPSHRPTRFR